MGCGGKVVRDPRGDSRKCYTVEVANRRSLYLHEEAGRACHLPPNLSPPPASLDLTQC